MSSSASYKDNLQYLPQRIPVRFQWKENKVVRGVLIWHRPYIYLQREEDEEPKILFHVWNSYVKHHVPKTDSNINPVDPRRIWNVLDLLDLIIYEIQDRVDGQIEPSLKTILTTYAPECIKALRSAPPEPMPSIPEERLEQERKQLLHLMSEPTAVEVGHRHIGSLKATLMPDGTFTYGLRKGLNSFQLLHAYRMECDPTFYRVESLLNWTSSLDLLYVQGGPWDTTLSKLVKARVPAKQEPPPVPAKVEPPPVPAKVEIPCPVISEEERKREATQMAAVWKAHIREGYDAPICIVNREGQGLCYLYKNGTFSYLKGVQFNPELHSLELLWHLNPTKVQGHTTAVQFFFFDVAMTDCLLPATEPSLSAVLKTLEERESALKARLEGLQIAEKGRLTAIEEARKRIAQLEADVTRLEKALA
jgi:hypothetical protein